MFTFQFCYCIIYAEARLLRLEEVTSGHRPSCGKRRTVPSSGLFLEIVVNKNNKKQAAMKSGLFFIRLYTDKMLCHRSRRGRQSHRGTPRTVYPVRKTTRYGTENR